MPIILHDSYVSYSSLSQVDPETEDWNRSLGMLVPGQSGHPMSPHYADNIQGWLNGEYHPMLFDREAVLKEADATLVIEPA